MSVGLQMLCFYLNCEINVIGCEGLAGVNRMTGKLWIVEYFEGDADWNTLVWARG